MFVGTALIYDDAVNLGARAWSFSATSPPGTSSAPSCSMRCCAMREKFELQVSLQVCLDIVAITLLMYASGVSRAASA